MIDNYVSLIVIALKLIHEMNTTTFTIRSNTYLVQSKQLLGAHVPRNILLHIFPRFFILLPSLFVTVAFLAIPFANTDTFLDEIKHRVADAIAVSFTRRSVLFMFAKR